MPDSFWQRFRPSTTTEIHFQGLPLSLTRSPPSNNPERTVVQTPSRVPKGRLAPALTWRRPEQRTSLHSPLADSSGRMFSAMNQHAWQAGMRLVTWCRSSPRLQVRWTLSLRGSAVAPNLNLKTLSDSSEASRRPHRRRRIMPSDDRSVFECSLTSVGPTACTPAAQQSSQVVLTLESIVLYRGTALPRAGADLPASDTPDRTATVTPTRANILCALDCSSASGCQRGRRTAPGVASNSARVTRPPAAPPAGG